MPFNRTTNENKVRRNINLISFLSVNAQMPGSIATTNKQLLEEAKKRA